jgi:hypothetical protein
MAKTNNEPKSFTETLKELRQDVDHGLVRQREGWRDRNGNVQMVDYVEWHTVADILDETAPNWSHAVKDIREIGAIFAVTVAITIDGITREGIGTGTAQSEMGIKKAEHDALKRAAVKFGIARDLYKKESDVIEREGSHNGFDNNQKPTAPVARNLDDLVTAKQLGMIRAICRELGLDPDEVCTEELGCKTDELSRKAASWLIGYVQDLQKERDTQFPKARPFHRDQSLNANGNSNGSSGVSANTAGKLLFESGAVTRGKDGYIVKDQVDRKPFDFIVSRHESGTVQCTCSDYKAHCLANAGYCCAHKAAVRMYTSVPEAA